ncbi:MAG: O-antigen ligase family protein [Chloroflexota bacterium]|nr:O-antigen ligase family protein [Chloroflexota bacterium]
MGKGLLVFVGVLLLATALLLWAGVLPATPSVDPPTQAVIPRHSPIMGTNVALQQYGDNAQRYDVLQAIAGAGFGWVRQRFPWDLIEPEPQEFDWSQWDEIVRAIDESGLSLVAVLDGSPAWARPQQDSANPLAPPGTSADFGNFAAAFAQRYGEQIRFYQVWDEPNIAPHWGAGPVDATEYAGLLREAAIQIREADPEAIVMAAALAPNVEPGGINQSDISYLDDLYSSGAAPYFDAVSAQPYGFDLPPSDPAHQEVLNFNRAMLLRDVMQDHEDAGTALWLSSFGWHAPSPTMTGSESPWKSVDEATQAEWAAAAAERARGFWPWLGGMAWAWWQPPQPAGDPHWGFALVTEDGLKRPALNALDKWNHDVKPLSPGVWPPSHPAVSQQGGWRITDLAADPPHGATIANNRLLVQFEGTGAALTIQRGPYWGYLDVTVDGAPANALPVDDNGRSNLLLHDPLAGRAVVSVARNLAGGPHRMEISAHGGWQQWPLEQIVIESKPATSWPAWLPWLLAGIGLICLMASSATVRSWVTSTGSQSPAGIQQRFERLDNLPVPLVYGAAALLALLSVILPGFLGIIGLGLLFLWLVPFPAAGIALIALSIPLFLVPVHILGRGFSPTELIIWMTAVALVVRTILVYLATGRDKNNETNKPLLKLSILDWAVVALLLISILSLPFAVHFGVAAREFRTVILAGVLVYGLVRLSPPVGKGAFDPWPVTWAVGLGALIVAVWGLSQAVTGLDLIVAEGVRRIRGPFGSPNNLALYLAHVAPVLIAVSALGRSRNRRILALLLLLPVLAALLLTYSKGALILGLPAAILFLGFAAGGRWRWIALATVAAGFLLLIPLYSTERFAGLFDLNDGTSYQRVQLWRGAWNMIKDNPWLGVGLDNFLYTYRTIYALPTAWQELNLSHPHNILLDFWTRLGLIGVIVGVWLFAAGFWQGRQRLKSLSGDQWALMLGLLASLVATLLHGLIDNSVFLTDLMILFMLSLGLIGRSWNDI